MFAKLKESKVFKTLSGALCSIELVENTRQDSRFPPLSSPQIKEKAAANPKENAKVSR